MLNDTPAEVDVELTLAERRRDLVLLESDSGVDANDIASLVLDGTTGTQSDSNRSVEWDCFRFIIVISRNVGLYLQLVICCAYVSTH